MLLEILLKFELLIFYNAGMWTQWPTWRGLWQLRVSTPMGLLLIALGASLVAFPLQYQSRLIRVSGSSMSPTLVDGTLMLTDRLPRHNILSRGDIVVLHDGTCRVIKRVVGIPGDHLVFSKGYIYVHGRKLYEPYLPKGTKTFPQDKHFSYKLESNHYLVLGDNRAASLDSRYYGPVAVSKFLGYVPYTGPKPELTELPSTQLTVYAGR